MAKEHLIKRRRAAAFPAHRIGPNRIMMWRWLEECGLAGAFREAMAIENDMVSSQINIGSISLAVALNYLGFRLPELDWKQNHPNLVNWYEAMAMRPSMIATNLHL